MREEKTEKKNGFFFTNFECVCERIDFAHEKDFGNIHLRNSHQLTDLLTNPCGSPWGCTVEIAETVGGGPADGGGTDVGAPALCGASCGVVL